MSFNSPAFLFFLFPVSLLVYYAIDRRYKNLVALAASLVFFAWGQWFYLPLMVLLILVNYFLAHTIEQKREEPQQARPYLWAGIIFDLVILFFFKIVAGYGTGWLSFLPEDWSTQLTSTPLPLGLSYVTFQVISYLLDVYNEACDAEKHFLNFGLYVLLFPKIVIGPITRYRDLASQLTDREITAQGAASGARRFIQGLAKKVLIADILAQVVNPAMSLSSPNFSTGIAWLVLVGYTVQLYFDFSGYTDMAIGLGQMMGFRFVENFNYPYISRSVTEFWRRWHISLSSWFRDYVFIPLEFARRRDKFLRQQTDILIVFLLTGLWHGVTVNFVIWGLIHGLALAVEMTPFGRWLKKSWTPLQHIYTLLVVMVAWVFFRAPSLAYAVQWLARLAGSSQGLTALPYSATKPLPLIDPSVWLALGLGIFLSLPVLPALRKAAQRLTGRFAWASTPVLVGSDLLLFGLLVSAVAATVGSSYVASIYGGF